MQVSPEDRPPLDLADLYTVEQFVQAFPQLFSLNLLRWQLRHRDANGLAPACVRVGKKLLISRSRYQHWLSTQGAA